MNKTLSIRFDVDTHICLSEGVPRLLELARETGVKFTFYINMGVAISRIESVKALLNKNRQTGPVVTSLSARAKLGSLQYLNVALFNPSVGLSHLSVIQAAAEQGHEVGLHGGRNHDLWARYASTWEEEKVSDEIDWGLHSLKKAGVTPTGFSSPGWTTPIKCLEVLKRFNFKYLADEHGAHKLSPDQKSKLNINSIYTAMAGEPGGVGFLEWCRASGLNDLELFEEFEKRLHTSGDHAVMYDHPYYSGRKEIPALRTCIERARGRGFKIETIAEHLKIKN